MEIDPREKMHPQSMWRLVRLRAQRLLSYSESADLSTREFLEDISGSVVVLFNRDGINSMKQRHTEDCAARRLENLSKFAWDAVIKGRMDPCRLAFKMVTELGNSMIIRVEILMIVWLITGWSSIPKTLHNDLWSSAIYRKLSLE
uniref:ORF-2 n=1 Tax=Snake paramyxovirus TaxID=659372 RepID=E7D7K1_9MONO|nr:ORF-2 [Snake paramyxovirus]ADT91319.1 ORF-2 [Snake paramyxovirus]